MSTKFKTVITTAGAAKLAAATVPGGKKVTLSAMAVGDGNGKLPVPDAGQTKLVHEVWRHALNKVSVDNKNKNYIVAELVVPPEVGGFWMRELGLYDDAGTLIAVANMAESYKPELAEGSGRAQTCRMVIIVSNVASVELSIDASTVMATQDYVDKAISSFHRTVIDDVVLQHKVVHDIDYAGIFDGADNMSQGFCICDTPQGTRMFLHQPVSGGVRIVETTFNPDGENENPTVISFSPVFADIGHQSIGAVCEDGRVMLYTPTADGKGVNIINWNGADTSLTDVTRTEIFTSDFFTGDEIITVALSVDGSLLIVQSSNEAVHLHYNRDDRRTVYVFDRASLTFKHRIYLSTQSMVSQAFQGMASDGHYLFAYYGYTGVFLTHRIVVYNLSTGEVVRQFNVDGVRARYGRQKMLGNAELGYPVLQEAEGLALHNGKLYLLDMDFWCQTADVVSFEGAYFAARATNFSGRSPVNPSYWTPTAYGTAAATKYDATKSYTCGVATKRSKAVVSVEAYDGTGYLVDSGVAFPDSHASLFLSPNAVNIALSPNEDFQVAAYEQNLRSHRPLFEVRKEAPDTDTSAAVFRLYGDAFRTGEYTGRFVQWKHRLNTVHDCLEIRADVDLLSGGGINLYSMNDTQSAGRTRLYCTDGSETWSVLLSPVSPAFHPDQDKAMNLGSSPNRWNVAYLQGVNIKSDDETQKRMAISTTLKAGAFQVSTAGNLGIYDDSADAYVIAARSDGTAFM
ncbi:TPA: phage tail protein, partial [Escherichia coli]